MNSYHKGPQHRPSDPPQNKLSLLERKLDRGEINPGVWRTYFPDLTDGKIPSCEDCAAFEVCIYDHDLEPIACLGKQERHFI